MYNEIMYISRDRQLSLVKEAKLLIDENANNAEVLEHTKSLALVIFGILSNDGDAGSIFILSMILKGSAVRG